MWLVVMWLEIFSEIRLNRYCSKNTIWDLKASLSQILISASLIFFLLLLSYNFKVSIWISYVYWCLWVAYCSSSDYLKLGNKLNDWLLRLSLKERNKTRTTCILVQMGASKSKFVYAPMHLDLASQVIEESSFPSDKWGRKCRKLFALYNT